MRKFGLPAGLLCLLISGCCLRRPLEDCNGGSCGAATPKNVKAGPPLVDETVRTELSIQLDSRYQFGQIQVDMKALEQKTADLRKLNEQLKKAHQEAQKKRREEQAKSGTIAVAGLAADCGIPGTKGIGIPDDAFMPKVLTPVDIPLMIPVTLRTSMGDTSLSNVGVRKRLLKTPCPDPKTGPCVPVCAAPDVSPMPQVPGVERGGEGPPPDVIPGETPAGEKPDAGPEPEVIKKKETNRKDAIKKDDPPPAPPAQALNSSYPAATRLGRVRFTESAGL